MALVYERTSSLCLPTSLQETSKMRRRAEPQLSSAAARRLHWAASLLWASLFLIATRMITNARSSTVPTNLLETSVFPKFKIRTDPASPPAESASESSQEEQCTKVLDMVFVIDESGSIGSTNFKRVREFVGTFIEALPVSQPEVHVAAVAYGYKVRVLWDFSSSNATDKSKAMSTVLRMSYASGSATYTHAALDEALAVLTRRRGARQDVPKVIVLLTDGSSSKRAETLQSARRAREAGIQIFVIGVGSANAVECRHICGCTSDLCPSFISASWSTLASKVLAMMDEVCKKLPKDALCSSWSDWSTCSVSCGEGQRKRTRSQISDPVPGDPPCDGCSPLLGKTCEELGGLEIVEQCNQGDCPVNAGCGDWGPWSPLSASCGVATQVRYRVGYNHPPPQGAGLFCEQQTPPVASEETKYVELPPCVVETVGEWSVWSTCSVTCGSGEQRRTRVRIVQVGDEEPKEEVEHETEACNTHPCPINAECGDFGEWSPCSRSCGGGVSVRQREPWSNNQQYGGLTCRQQHPDGRQQSRDCNTQACPVNEVLGDWLEWGSCSVSCGPGLMKRQREPSPVRAANGGLTLEEQIKAGSLQAQLEETKECNLVPCGPCTYPFEEWSECQGTCGNESRSRHTAVKFDYLTTKCHLPTHDVETCVSSGCAEGGGAGEGAGAGGGTAGGGTAGEAGGATGEGEEQKKEEAEGVPVAAIAGGIVGGAVLLGAIAGGAYYGLAGKAAEAAAPPQADFGEEAPQEAVEEDREAMIAIDEESDMWRT